MRAHARAVAAGTLWGLAGGGWVASAFLPWTTRGLLATSSPLDAVRLIRTGVIDGATPPGTSAALLTLPAVGVGLIGLAGFEGRVVRAIRVALLVLAAALLLGALQVLTGISPGRFDRGAWTAVVALGCALAALVIGSGGAWRRRPGKEAR
jgi:hypothetical protein